MINEILLMSASVILLFTGWFIFCWFIGWGIAIAHKTYKVWMK